MMCLISVNRTLLVSKGCYRSWGALTVLWTPRAWLHHPWESSMPLLAGGLSIFAHHVMAHWVTPSPRKPPSHQFNHSETSPTFKVLGRITE